MRPRVRCSTPRRTHLPPQLGSPVGLFRRDATLGDCGRCRLAHAGRMFSPRKNFRVRQTLDSSWVFDFSLRRDLHSRLPTSISESIVRILNDLILELNETLLSSPPFRNRVFERWSDSREDLGASGTDFLLKKPTYTAAMKYIADDYDFPCRRDIDDVGESHETAKPRRLKGEKQHQAFSSRSMLPLRSSPPKFIKSPCVRWDSFKYVSICFL
jgi:hypothetical protein